MAATNTRRDFLLGAGGGLGLAVVAAHWPSIAAAHAHATAAGSAPDAAAIEFLTAAEARTVDAIVAQIVPTDDTPGAREAGALYFIDRSLRTWAAPAAPRFRSGLADFAAAFAAAHAGQDYATATTDAQLDFLVTVDSGPFFELVRFLTLLGLFALPAYGGNRDGVGWKLIGFDDRHGFSPPFGYYDARYEGFAGKDSA